MDSFKALFGLISVAIPAFGQTTILPYRPVAAEYSAASGRIVMISSNPDRLHIYDPVTGADVPVTLPKPPLALSISPDGAYAAVGHDALLSYVNLTTATMEKSFPISGVAQSVVLAPAWIYVMPTYQGEPLSVNIGSGEVTVDRGIFYGSGGKLDPSVNAIYGTRDGLSPNDIEKYDISTGPITKQSDSVYHGDYSVCGPVFFSPDGGRIYSGCATVFHASTDPDLDMRYVATLPVRSVQSLAESAATQKIAILEKPRGTFSSDTADDTVVTVLESGFLNPVGTLALPPIQVNGRSIQAHGKWISFSQTGGELYALVQADQESGLLNDFAIERISLLPSACGATFSISTFELGNQGTRAAVDVSAEPGCVHQAASDSAWLKILSGGYGSGDQTLTFHVAPNPDGSLRTGTIRMGGRALRVTQAAGGGSDSLLMLGVDVVEAVYSRSTDRLILVAANPNELQIHDLATHERQIVPLVSRPLSLSVRPDGLYALVGHDGWVSYVNLQAATVEKVIPVITDVAHVALASNGYGYLFPARDWSEIYSLEISTETLTGTSAIYSGRVPRLSSDGKYLYVGGNWFSKWDISGGVAKLAQNVFGVSTCGNLWLAADGRRLFAACGKVYRTSEVPAEDLQYNGTLGGLNSVRWVDHSTQQNALVVIPGATSSGTVPGSSTDGQLQFYGYEFLDFTGAIPLPKVVTGGNLYAPHGRVAFWNSAGTTVYVILDADPAASLAAGSGLAVIAPSAARQVMPGKVLNGASLQEGPLAPGEIITITGKGLGPAAGQAFSVDPDTGKVATSLAGTQVFIGSAAAPLLYVSATQINAIVPYEFFGSTALVVVSDGLASEPRNVSSAQAAPGIFTLSGSGSGQAVAIHPDGSLVDSAHPASPGSYVTLYFTGGGRTNPSGVTGSVTGAVIKRLQQAVTARVGEVPATVLFAGAAPNFVDGVGQINLQLGGDTAVGDSQPVVITVGNNNSPATATIAVR